MTWQAISVRPCEKKPRPRPLTPSSSAGGPRDNNIDNIDNIVNQRAAAPTSAGVWNDRNSFRPASPTSTGDRGNVNDMSKQRAATPTSGQRAATPTSGGTRTRGNVTGNNRRWSDQYKSPERETLPFTPVPRRTPVGLTHCQLGPSKGR